MLALVQLIFQELAVNTHFQKTTVCLTAVPSLFIAMFSYLLLIFHFRLTSITSCLCDLPSAVLDWLLWLICFLEGPSSPTHILCCLLASACAWLSQGCPQSVIQWLLFTAALPVSSAASMEFTPQFSDKAPSEPLHICQCPYTPLLYSEFASLLVFILHLCTHTPLPTTHFSPTAVFIFPFQQQLLPFFA